MTNFNGSISPLGYQGINIEQQPIFIGNQVRAPNSGDIYPPGTIWDYVAGTVHTFYISCGGQPSGGVTSGVWTVFGSSSGDILAVNGTANQVTVVTASGTATVSLPSSITTPGSLTTTTSLTGGTGVTATTGNISASAGNVSASGTVTGGTGVVATTGNVSATAGAVNAGTSMTATNGNITATLGNVVINGAEKQLQVHGGAATDFIGTTTLVNGVSPSVANTNIAATDVVLIVRTDANSSTAIGSFLVTVTPTTGFVVTSLKADATTETGDQSIVKYFIVRQV